MPTNYTELVQEVQDWLNLPTLEQTVPVLITLAEATMSRRVRHQSMIRRSTAAITTQYTALPVDWVETIRFSLTSPQVVRLELAPFEEILDYREGDNQTGVPAYYAHVGGEIELYPTPSGSMTGELVYYGKVPALTAAAPTNWLLTAAPDAYLYGCLVAAEPFLSKDARLPVWQSLFEQAIAELNASSDAARYSGTGFRLRFR